MQIQIIDFTNDFDKEDIPREGPFFIELTSCFNIGIGKFNVVVRLKKILYGQAKYACLWYEKLLNDLLDRSFVVIKADPWLFMYTTVIYVEYVDDCLFCAR